ncbi:hypothetical protein FOXG_17139 [Fusarium oxysporum f. sp. lycopersici 4287]|uniref:GRAM domain-containing protein n=3 Tax=Fusarium oxysporum TaxID=5507 RepID=A0A0J9WVU6_FUSO4|nr:uncharacterized protein FOXG_17139 [Fusarium oxysporum f. sp. lycopersici 4287]EXK28556.1 hypothetical protein FOMG_15025 [Fusarium oxysporum f. sp. melonis 26406]KAJ9414692.1 hypothetical protein QL093DRAFT_2471637 [Fusarium oxysporum]KNB20147.1 hypothetical protein FOXG_17139 [Fusarium oxysporum f. sp. lycopersici 4287]
MDLRSDDVLPGEKVLMKKAANAMININDYKLSRFFADDLARLFGKENLEAIGGKLYLTNYRLLFKSHSINRVTGKFSVALPTIIAVEDTSKFLTKRIDVTTSTETFQFVVWGIPELIDKINETRLTLEPVEVKRLQSLVLENYKVFGDGMTVAKSIEGINKALLAARKAGVLTELATRAGNPLEITGILNFLELMGDEQG